MYLFKFDDITFISRFRSPLSLCLYLSRDLTDRVTTRPFDIYLDYPVSRERRMGQEDGRDNSSCFVCTKLSVYVYLSR